MKKVSNWYLTWTWARRIKELASSPHVVKNETDALKANCISDILNRIESSSVTLPQLLHKYGVKQVQNQRSRIHRDDFDKQKLLPNPVFSQSQISSIKSKWGYLLFLIIFCMAGEAVLYYLTAAILVPNGTIVMKITAGSFIAIVFMALLDFSFKSYFQYLEALNQKENNETKLKEYVFRRNAAYVFVPFVCIALFSAGISRIYFLEYIPPGGLSPEKLHSVLLSSKWASILTLITTILVSFLMGFIKQEFSKVNKQYMEYREWHTAHVRANKCLLEIIQLARTIYHTTEVVAEMYWLLVIDLKRIVQDKEYDAKYEALHTEYWNLRIKKGFVVTDEIYRKFSPIQSVYAELFRFGVLNDPVIKEKRDFVIEILKTPKEHIAEHLRALMEAKEPKQIVQPFSLNGSSKKHELIIN